jgi:membrane protein DedA with SNARE-associated domain
MDWVEAFVRDYGYVAVLVLTFLEGETVLVIAGVAAQQGHLKLHYVMLAAFCGSLISDQLAFFIGRRFGARWLARRPNIEARLARARGLIERHQIPITLGFRFLYGLRNVIPFALGMSRMATGRYVILNIIGAAVWAVALAAGGYALGLALKAVLHDVAAWQRWILLGLAVAGVAFFLYSRRREKKKADDATRDPKREIEG